MYLKAVSVICQLTTESWGWGVSETPLQVGAGWEEKEKVRVDLQYVWINV